MNVLFRASFDKDLQDINDSQLLTHLRRVVEKVENASTLQDIRHLKKLKSVGKHYRIRVGDYRIGISIAEDTVVFIRCLHRSEIYRYFP